MKTSQQILAFALFLALMVKEGISIRCFQCNTYANKDDCPGPVGGKFNFDCPSKNQTMCRKIEQQIYYDGDDHTRTFYDCAERGKVSSECKERTGTYRFKSWYCQCNKNDCNSASSVIVSLALTVSGVCAVLGVRKLL